MSCIRLVRKKVGTESNMPCHLSPICQLCKSLYFPRVKYRERPEIMLIELSLSGKRFVFSLSQLADNLSFNMIHICGSWRGYPLVCVSSVV